MSSYTNSSFNLYLSKQSPDRYGIRDCESSIRRPSCLDEIQRSRRIIFNAGEERLEPINEISSLNKKFEIGDECDQLEEIMPFSSDLQQQSMSNELKSRKGCVQRQIKRFEPRSALGTLSVCLPTMREFSSKWKIAMTCLMVHFCVTQSCFPLLAPFTAWPAKLLYKTIIHTHFFLTVGVIWTKYSGEIPELTVESYQRFSQRIGAALATSAIVLLTCMQCPKQTIFILAFQARIALALVIFFIELWVPWSYLDLAEKALIVVHLCNLVASTV